MQTCTKNRLTRYPRQLENFCVFATIKFIHVYPKKLSAHAIEIKCLCNKKPRNPLEFQKTSAPEPSRTSQSTCAGTLRNLTKHLLRQNPPDPHKVSAPETFPNLTRSPHRNLPEPHQASSPPKPSGPEPHKISARESSGTSQGICPRTLRTSPRIFTYCEESAQRAVFGTTKGPHE